jgi:hypothetical protein
MKLNPFALLNSNKFRQALKPALFLGCWLFNFYLSAQVPYLFKRFQKELNSNEYNLNVRVLNQNELFIAYNSRLPPEFFWKIEFLKYSISNDSVLNRLIVGDDSSNLTLGYSSSTSIRNNQAVIGVGSYSKLPYPNPDPTLISIDLNDFSLDYFKQEARDSLNFYGQSKILSNSIVAIGYDDLEHEEGSYLVSKHKLNGDLIWTKTFGTSYFDVGTSIIESELGELYLFGGSRGYGSEPGFYNQALLIKTDSLGNELWRTTWGGYFDDCANNLAATPDGGVIACGCISAEPPESDGYTFGYIRKMNSLGELVWDFTFPDKSLNEGSRTSSYAVCRVLENGNIIAVGTGYAWASDSITDRIVPRAIILDKNGNVLMERAYTSLVGGYSSAEFQDIQPTADGGFIAGGTYYPSQGDTGNQDAFIVKLDERGCEFAECQPPLAVEELSDEVGFELKVWPNPAQDILNIEASSTIKEVHIFDQMGREVFSTPLELTKSRTTEQLSVSSFKTGLYFLVVKTAKGVETKKVIIE